MSFVLRLNTSASPPVFKDLNGCRYEYRCGWCPCKFQDAHQLVRHVCRERDR